MKKIADFAHWDETDEDQMKLLCIELLIAVPLVIDAILRSLELKKMMG